MLIDGGLTISRPSAISKVGTESVCKALDIVD